MMPEIQGAIVSAEVGTRFAHCSPEFHVDLLGRTGLVIEQRAGPQG
jgi:hypothetical protein